MGIPSSTNPRANAVSGEEPTGSIFHITRRDAWQAAEAGAEYLGNTLSTEGFIHCSTLNQVAGAANRFYQGQSDLVLLEIDPARLESPVIYEGLESGELFPHIYGPLQVKAVIRLHNFKAGPDGLFKFPA